MCSRQCVVLNVFIEYNFCDLFAYEYLNNTEKNINFFLNNFGFYLRYEFTKVFIIYNCYIKFCHVYSRQDRLNCKYTCKVISRNITNSRMSVYCVTVLVGEIGHYRYVQILTRNVCGP